MERQLKFSSVLSLEKLSLRSVAVLLWNESNMLVSLSKVRIPGYLTEKSKKEWQEMIENRIKDKISNLELPQLFTKQIIDVVRPIGLQIRRWKDFQRNVNERFCLPNSVKLSWTMAGTINYRETAEKLVRCDELSVSQRYKLACINCLEDDIPLLWEKLPEESKNCFLNAGIPSPKLECCWAYIVRGELSELDSLWRTSDRDLTSFNQWAFECSAEKGNKTAVKYFFQKLTHEEREVSLFRTVEALLNSKYLSRFRSEKFSEVSYYLLSLMTPEKQMEIVRKRPIDVLLCFLDLSWPELFLENAGLILSFLPQNEYWKLLWKMARRFEMSDHYFPKLFQEFFSQSPLELKKCFVYNALEYGITPASNFLSIFFRCGDSESIEVMFRNLNATDRVKVVLQRRVLSLFFDSILKGRWYLVEVCLREAMPPKEDRERLKETFVEFLKRNNKERDERANQNLEGIFDFFDRFDDSCDNRKKVQRRKLEN